MYLKSIALSGGPCGGKTTMQKVLSHHFTSKGFEVHLIHEVASMIVFSGIHFKQMPAHKIPELQRNILLIQLALEKQFEALSQLSDKPVLLISDRGGMDALAYVDDLWKQRILHEEGLHPTELRDGRYDGVFHMITSANGAQEGFRESAHTFRNESIDEAIQIDNRQLLLWLGHPHLRVFNNQCSFHEKCARVLRAADALLGIPEPIEFERKYLIEPIRPEQLPVPYCTVEIEQHYLTDNQGAPVRLRKRGQDGGWIYFCTRKTDISKGKRTENEQRISETEFHRQCLTTGTQYRGYVKKNRTCFVYDSQYLELDIFTDPETGYTLLEYETDDDTTPVSFPPFLRLIREVTGEKEYTNYFIAATRQSAGRPK